MSWWNDPTSNHAFILSWVSVVLTTIAAVAGISFYMASGSALCLVFGLENIVDLTSSIIVLWRFYRPTKEREALLVKREKRASTAISFVLVLLGIGVFGAAADDFVGGAETENDLKIVTAISFVSIFVFGSMTVVKFRYASKLNSASLHKDGLCSLIGTVLATGLFVTTLVVEKAPSTWWLDPVFAMVCGFIAMMLGLHAIFVARYVQGLPIFSIKWWMVSQGDGMDEMGGRDLQSSDFGEEGDKTVEMPGSGEKRDDTKLSEVV